MSTKIDDLIAAGAVQISRKYRRLFIPPQNPVAWLREHDPRVYDRLVEDALHRFEISVRDLIHNRSPDALTVELSPEEFDTFREKVTGEKPWTIEGKTHCPGCGSFGHMHRSTCPVA